MRTSYVASPAGRIVIGTMGFALLAAGALAAAGPGAHQIVFISVVPLLCIVAAIFAIGMSVRDHGAHAFLLLLALPISAGPYLGLLIVAPQAGLAVALALLVPGFVLGSIAVLGPREEASPEREEASPKDDHAGTLQPR